jgi:hypothetical protein
MREIRKMKAEAEAEAAARKKSLRSAKKPKGSPRRKLPPNPPS